MKNVPTLPKQHAVLRTLGVPFRDHLKSRKAIIPKSFFLASKGSKPSKVLTHGRMDIWVHGNLRYIGMHADTLRNIHAHTHTHHVQQPAPNFSVSSWSAGSEVSSPGLWEVPWGTTGNPIAGFPRAPLGGPGGGRTSRRLQRALQGGSKGTTTTTVKPYSA